jgi:hypothetical protein
LSAVRARAGVVRSAGWHDLWIQDADVAAHDCGKRNPAGPPTRAAVVEMLEGLPHILDQEEKLY